MDKADGDGLDTFGPDLADDGTKVFFAQRLIDGAIPAQALAYLVHVSARHQAPRLVILERIELFAVPTRDGIRVPQPRRRDQQHARALALEKRIETHRGSVHREGNVLWPGDKLLEAGQDALGGIMRSRQALPGHSPVRVLVHDHK